MFLSDLFQEILVKPAQEGADTLYAVTGFASAAFCADYLLATKDLPGNPSVRLIVGMMPFAINPRSNHHAFKELVTTSFPLTFECRYVIEEPFVHAKAYAWYKGAMPYRGFVGSANFTRVAFRGESIEVLEESDPCRIKELFDHIWDRAVDCFDPKAEELISKLSIATSWSYSVPVVSKTLPEENKTTTVYDKAPEKVSIRLVDKTGQVPRRSGLNWGQRQGREPNQAYLSVPSKIAKSSFFPPLKHHFTVITDDEKSLICVRAQPKKAGGTIGHAIETPLNNSTLGIYFRHRLGLAEGQLVTRHDLDRYGRNYVDFYKIDSENYYMDFSRPSWIT